MDFLKDIVKEIGGEYTKLASDIDYCYCWRVFYWKNFLLSRCG